MLFVFVLKLFSLCLKLFLFKNFETFNRTLRFRGALKFRVVGFFAGLGLFEPLVLLTIFCVFGISGCL